jgi:hypothetical protein
MATAVFTVLGSAAGSALAGALSLGPLATSIVTAIGSVIGAGIGNELFPVNVQGPRFKGVNQLASSYGVPIPLIYGAENRVSGNVIWSTGLVEKATKKKVGSFPARSTITIYTYSVSAAVAIGQGPCKNIKRIWLNKKLAFDSSAYGGSLPDDTPWTVTSGISYETAPFYSLAWYPGTSTQLADPTMQAALGAGEVPAYRGTAYVVFKDLQLADYGNVMPTVEVELEGVGGDTLYEVVQSICTKASLGIGDFAISPALAASTVRGYAISESGNAMGAMQPLLTAYGLLVTEYRGEIRIQPRNTGAIATVPIDEMAARESDGGAEAKPPLRITRGAETALPREVSITYLDAIRDYQPNSQKSVRAFGDTLSNVAVELPLTLTADEAKLIADRALREPWRQRLTVAFAVSPRFGYVMPGQMVNIEIAGVYVGIRILSVVRGNNGVYEMEGAADDTYVFDGSNDGIAPAAPANPLRVVTDSVGYLFNAPILSEDQTESGYIAVVDNAGGTFGGSVLYSSVDDVTFDPAVSFAAKNITGSCTTTLAACVTADAWDYKNTLTVALSNNTDNLTSVTALEVLNGANLAWVGRSDGSTGELIQFQTVSETSPGTFVLSNLLRGRRGTEFATGTHVASEKFVLLDSWADVDFTETDVLKTRYFKFVSLRQDVDDVTSSSFVGRGEGGVSRSVALASTDRNASNDVSVSWLPRTRWFSSGIGYGPIDLRESESYEIDWTDSAGTTVYRTVATTSRTTTYTATEQTADGLTPSATRYGTIYQISASRGRGYPTRFIIT